jgi:ribosome-binding protein aMBF1 (putative translation factor)
MSRQSIENHFEQWRQQPDYVREYEALESEFALAETLIAARRRAGLSQKELASRIATDQSNISKWESGSVMPSTRTLQRIADVTGHRLTIAFVPKAG